MNHTNGDLFFTELATALGIKEQHDTYLQSFNARHKIDQFDQVHAALARVAAWGETACTNATLSTALADVDKIAGFCGTNPFSLSGSWFTQVWAKDTTVPELVRRVFDATYQSNNVRVVEARHMPIKLTALLKDDAAQFKAAATALGTDPDFARICQAQGWKWAWVILTKRAGVAFADVVTAAPKSAQALSGGTQTPPWRVEYTDPALGLRVFKHHESLNDSASRSIARWAFNSTARTLATARYDALVFGKIDNSVRAHYHLLTGDTKLAVVQLGLGGKAFGTITTFFKASDGFKATTVIKGDKIFCLNINRADPAIYSQAVALETFDRLTAQTDRNGGNIMVSQLGGNQPTKCVGIDSDMSFAFDAPTLEGVGKTMTNTPLPFFDKWYAEAVSRVSDNELDTALKGLAAPEVAGAKARLAAFKTLYAASEPAARWCIANAGNGERLWSEFQLTDLPPKETGGRAKTHIIQKLLEDVVANHKPENVNLSRVRVVTEVDGFQTITVNPDQKEPVYLVSRLLNEANGSDLHTPQ